MMRGELRFVFLGAQTDADFHDLHRFWPFFICVNHKNPRHLRAIVAQSHAERSIQRIAPLTINH
jgi:hypothetical protein